MWKIHTNGLHVFLPTFHPIRELSIRNVRQFPTAWSPQLHAIGVEDNGVDNRSRVSSALIYYVGNRRV